MKERGNAGRRNEVWWQQWRGSWVGVEGLFNHQFFVCGAGEGVDDDKVCAGGEACEGDFLAMAVGMGAKDKDTVSGVDVDVFHGEAGADDYCSGGGIG